MRSKLRFLTLISGISAMLVWAAAALLLTTSTPTASPAPTEMVLPSVQNSTSVEALADRTVASNDGSIQSDFLRASPSQAVVGQVVIRFAAHATQEQRAEYLTSIGGTVSSTIDALDTVIVTLSQNTTLLPSDIVAVSEPDYYVSALYSIPTSDTYYPDQWALTAIGAPEAWSTAANAPKLTLAVIDSGVFAGHGDLSGRVLNGWDFVQDDATPQDEFGHGTAISGIIAANIDNGIGIAGVAPNVEILPLRVLNAQGIGTYSDVAAAMVYATDNGARIINLSLGGANPSGLLESAVTYATSRGVMVIAAAGNSGVEGALYPAAYPAVIAVGSVDSTLQRSSFSNYGSQVDVYAPGRDILATGKDGSYVRVSGTSFAAPHVAGVAALELARGKSLSLNGGILHLLAVESEPTPIPTDVPIADAPSDNVEAQAVTCTYTQITQTLGVNNYLSSISGDGLRIAFTSDGDYLGENPSNFTQLFLWDVNGSVLDQITEFAIEPGPIIPYLNYDGSRMAVVVAQDLDLIVGNSDLSYEIFLWEAGSFTQLTNITASSPPGPEPKLAISDAGNRIAFLWSQDVIGNSNNSEELFLWDETFVSVQQVTESSGSAPLGHPPTMSDDGLTIAFSHDRDLVPDLNSDENYEIFVWSDNFLTQLTTTTGGQGSTMSTINGDGTRIAFVSDGDFVDTNVDGNTEIFLFDSAAGFSQLTNTNLGTSESFLPNLNSFGSRIVFSFGHNLTGGGGVAPFELYLWDEAQPAQGFSKATNESSPNVIPHTISDTGKYIAFQSTFDYVNNSDNNIEVFLAECGVPLTITRQPTDQLINNGGTASLAVTATGDAALTYQWYQGVSGDTSNPISGEIAATLQTPALSANTEYWVQVGDGLTTVDSTTATVTVLPASPLSCSLMQITDDPVFGSYAASISGDGTRMSFTSSADLTGDNPDHNNELFLWDETTGISQITMTLTGGVNGSATNGDGTRIAFQSASDLTGGNSDGSNEIFLWEAGIFTQITNTTTENVQNPSINLSGTRIAYMSNADPVGNNSDLNDELFLWDAPSTITQVTDTTAASLSFFYGVLSWDGSRVLIVGYDDFTGDNPDGNRELFIWDSTTLTITQITDTVGDNLFNLIPSGISGDGTRIGLWSVYNFIGDNGDFNYEAFIWDDTTANYIQATKTSVQGAVSGSLNFDGTRMILLSPSNFNGGNADHNDELFLWDETLGFTQITDTTAAQDLGLDAQSMDNTGNRIGMTLNEAGSSEIYLIDCGGGDAPTITTEPQDQVIAGNSTATLSVTATGTAPLSYQWYQGVSGDITNPIFGATSDTYVTGLLSANTQFWVRVSNVFGSDNSVTATVTVTTLFCSTVTEIPPTECEALEFLYSSTGGSSWVNQTNWMSTPTPCSWFGVTCAGGHVTSLQLPANNLTNSLPGVLDNLDFLQTLSLLDNNLTGAVPPEIGSMNALQWLDLSNNDFTGGIPAAFGNSPGLQTLILADNPTLGGTIPAELGDISTLITLVLHNTGLTGSIPPQLGSLTNLEWLGLSDNELIGSIPTSFNGLANLEVLGLHNNKLSGAIPAELTQLTGLETLLLHNNAFIGQVPATITNMTLLGTVNNLPNYPWLFDDEVNLGFNALYASGATATFLTGKDPDWADTQTVAPGNLATGTVTTDSVALTWTAIPYIANNGNYSVEYKIEPAGSYIVHGTTTDKTATGYTVTGLASNTTYSFRVRTFTPLHDDQQNDLFSDYSAVVSTTTQIRFCDTVSEIPESECEALQALYNSTNGAAWTNSMGWLTDSTPCSNVNWFGVTCDVPGHVTRIELENNQLSGTLPPQLSDLTSLQILDLDFNQIGGNIPAQLWTMTSLTAISFNTNLFTGMIPASVGGLLNLQYLDLTFNDLMGNIPVELGNLTNLRFLSLASNQLSGSIPTQLGTLANLENLALSGNNLSGGIPTALGNLTNLQVVILAGNPLGGQIPQELGSLPNLAYLYLNNTQLTGQIPSQLGNLSNLYLLALSSNQLGGMIPTELGSLGNLAFLYLDDNQLSGGIPPQLGGLTDLQALHLDKNRISGAIPPELGSLTNLVDLHLENNQFSGDVPATIVNLTNLAPAFTDFGYNALYANNQTVRNFLFAKDPDWVYTQTVAPNSLTVSGVTIDSVTLSWVPILYMGDGGYYEIEYSTSSTGPFVVQTPNKSATGHTVIGLDDNTLHFFRVRTFTPLHGDQQNSLYSEYSSIVMATPQAPPATPTSLTAGPATMNTMPLTWVDVAADETHYSLERSTNGGSNWTPIALLPANTQTYTDTGLACNTTYHYRVRAYRAGDGKYSEYSDTDFAATLTCPPPEPQTAGLYKDGLWIFRDTNSTGQPDVSFRFGPQQAGWTPLVGDWDGDGVDGIGVYKDGAWILRNSASSGLRDMAFVFNPLGAGTVPVVGDWNSDGIDTIGVFKNGLWALRNSNSAGSHDMSFTFNSGSDWLPVTGDWNGDNFDTVGFYKDGRWLLSNALQSSPLTFNFKFGPTTTGWTPVTGDWDTVNGDSTGLYKDGLWRLRYTNDTGGPDIGFTFITGAVGWKPVAGYRGGVSGLMALGLSDEIVEPVLPTLSTPTPDVTQTTTPEVSATVTPDAPTASETPFVPTDTPAEIVPTVTESPPPSTETQVPPSETPETTDTP